MPSARKRRRLRLTPQRAAGGAGHGDAAPSAALHAPPAELLKVAGAIWKAASEARARVAGPPDQPPSDTAEAASSDGQLFNALLGVLAAAGASPDQLLKLCTPLVPVWLSAIDGTAGAEAGQKQQEALLSACQGMLAAISAAMEAATTSGAPASASLPAVQPAQLQQLLERGWEAVGSWEGPAGDRAHAAALLLSTALAATQAELLEGPELLQQLFSDAYRLASKDGAGSSGGGDALQRVFGLLLPAACAVAIGREEAQHSSSQPRATQAGGHHRRHHHHHHTASQHPPRLANTLVAILQQELCNLEDSLAGETSDSMAEDRRQRAGQAQQHAVAAGIAHGLLAVLQLAHQPTRMVQLAAQLALSGGAGPAWPARQPGTLDPDHQPVLASAVAEWVRPALEQLCSCGADLAAQVQVWPRRYLPMLPSLHTAVAGCAPGRLCDWPPRSCAPCCCWPIEAQREAGAC
jgi:hypothetical protein